MTPTTRTPPALLAALMALALTYLCPALAHAQPLAGAQPVAIRVLDAMDRPLAGARLELHPLAGQPFGKGPFVSGPEGMIKLAWTPRDHDDSRPGVSRDQVHTYITEFRYTVRAPGYAPARGRLRAEAVSRKMASPALARLNTRARFRPRIETVVLIKAQRVLGPGLAGHPALAKRCLDLYGGLQPVLASLGAGPAVPAFDYDGKALTVNFRFLAPSWRALEDLDYKQQAVISAGLPLAVALGRGLGGAPGVASLTLRLMAETRPANDPHALPRMKAVVITAPLTKFKALGAGRLDPAKFLAAHPPGLRRL